MLSHFCFSDDTEDAHSEKNDCKFEGYVVKIYIFDFKCHVNGRLPNAPAGNTLLNCFINVDWPMLADVISLLFLFARRMARIFEGIGSLPTLFREFSVSY